MEFHCNLVSAKSVGERETEKPKAGQTFKHIQFKEEFGRRPEGHFGFSKTVLSLRNYQN